MTDNIVDIINKSFNDDTNSQISNFVTGFENIRDKLKDVGIDYKDSKGDTTFESVMKSVSSNTGINDNIFIPFHNTSTRKYEASYYFAGDAHVNYIDKFHDYIKRYNNIDTIYMYGTYMDCTNSVFDSISLSGNEFILCETFKNSKVKDISISGNSVYVYNDIFTDCDELLDINISGKLYIYDNITISSPYVTKDSFINLFRVLKTAIYKCDDFELFLSVPCDWSTISDLKSEYYPNLKINYLDLYYL